VSVERLDLAIRSFADMSEERALAVARAFDAHPNLRPLRVGGDPARIRVEPSMEAIVGANGLPIEWLTVRRNEKGGAFESGSIDLRLGRGGWIGEQEMGTWRYSLTGHSIEQTWEADSLTEVGTVADVAGLFEELVLATDAAWGCVLPWSWWPRPLYTYAKAKLPGIYWLNYFGPAFVNARPALATVTGARILENGGVLIRTTEQPWQPYEDGIPPWQAEVRAMFGEAAFEWTRPNPALPTVDDHVAASPGTAEMPWVAWHAKRVDGDRAKKHNAALKRLTKASEGRRQLDLADHAVEWSTSLDLQDWQEFAKYLSRKLGGDLSAAIGKAAIAVIATAPIGDEGRVVLDTQYGVVRLDWFVDDETTVEIALWSAGEVRDYCDQWFGET